MDKIIYIIYFLKERSGVLEYRELVIEEAERILEIDATNYIKNVWRFDENTQEYKLIEINWTDTELPNGFEWHLKRLRETLENNGTAIGCFKEGVLIGYGTVDRELIGKKERYAFLDQLFVSNNQRGQGIGKTLFLMCGERAKQYGAQKLFLCAGSAENTIAFYKKLGCVPAAERNERLYEEDPRDIQLEYLLK